ncbi:hypothetical protein PMLGA01_070030300 [Plasmodium malariae]|uniref:Uncharacterized protein n=1 Tax=Plasmodium malariae TaxID=5858 RepID=A0A1C3KBZ4_PLAMA|nr:hypothetical protein PMLGA01_070030300 [Plasmodium malariae]
MSDKEAIFYNSVTDPYVVNYIWLYGNNITGNSHGNGSGYNRQIGGVALTNARCSNNINNMTTYMRKENNRMQILNNSEKREDLTS